MGLDVSIRSGDAQADDLSQGDQVEVYECIGEATTYRLRYSLEVDGADFPALIDGRLDPGATLAVAVPVGDSSQVLVKGQVYAQRMHFRHGVSDSWFEVIGGDATLEMDRELKRKVWPAQAVSDSISGILGAYPALQADVDSISTTTSEENHLLVQADTDLRFVRRLARRYGYWFWVTTDDTSSTAHFKRPSLSGTPTITLTVNNDTPNVTSLDLEWDVERPNQTLADQVGLRDKSPIDGHVDRSPLTTLGAQALADIASKRAVDVVAPVDAVGDLQGRSEGALIEAGWFVRVRGEASIRSLGDVLRAHTLVGVSGLGTRHSGTYLVWSVHHVIDQTAHVMKFELVRNGWGAS